jgi:hypothetical protein
MWSTPTVRPAPRVVHGVTAASRPTPSHRNPVWGWVVATVIAWTAVALARLFSSWLLTKLWLLGLLFLLVLFIIAAAVTCVATVVIARRTGAERAAAIGLAGGLLAMTVVLGDWNSAYARFWFALNRPQFVATADLARSGALGVPAEWDYYGPRLPAPLNVLSVNGRISMIDEAAGEPILFMPAYLGVPDDAYGFVHISGAHRPGSLDGYGDLIAPRIELGDGWWWADDLDG